MRGIGRRIGEHRGGERAARPVGLLVLLGELHAGVLFQERGEADRRLAGELGRDARVKQPPRPESVVTVENSQVVVRVVEDLLDFRIGEQLADGREVRHRQGVDDLGSRRARQLDQEDPVAVAVEARRLGIGGDERLPRQRRDGFSKRFGRADVAHSSLLSASRPAAISSSALASVL